MDAAAPEQRSLWLTDADLAREYWAGKEWKKYAVDIRQGKEKKPTYKRTVYVRARTGSDAVDWVKRNRSLIQAPARCWFVPRLAGPRELGCTTR